ncbi:MAG: hypothetical protein U0401_34340 [Anaerolineae bacterium]
MGRSLTDVAILLNAMTGVDPHDPKPMTPPRWPALILPSFSTLNAPASAGGCHRHGRVEG